MSFLKPFQMKIYEELKGLLAKNDVAMLAAATGSGKTEMMCQFITDNPKLRVLILAHGQKSLRTNFSDRLAKYDIGAYEMGHSSKKDVELANKARVVVALPQNVHKKLKSLKRFDVIVVDEAHEFYLPKDNSVMYPKIKAWHKGKCILLSASHYRVDAEKVFFSRENALAVGQIADAAVKLIEEVAKIDDEDISKDGFLKEKVRVPTSVQVISKVLNEKGRPPAIVAKHSVAAARELATDLAKVYKGKVCVSDASSDPLGENLEAFKAGKYDVCIVVYRGNLGFDYPGLSTFIDGTYTTNIQRMEQMLGRVVRKGGNGDDKKFIKLVPADAWTRGLLLGTAVLALSKDEVYREWRGDEAKIKLPGKPADLIGNLNNRTKNESVEEGEASGEGGDGTKSSLGQGEDESHREADDIDATVKKGSPKKNGVGQGSGARVPKMRTRKTLELTFGYLVGMFGGKDSCTLRQAINHAGLGSGIDPEGKKEEIMEFARKHRRRPNQKRPEERKLGLACSSYTSKSNKCYDPEFTKELDKLAPIVDTVVMNKKDIFAFVNKHGRRPSQKRPEEKKLGQACSSYTRKSHSCYDPEFTKELDKLAPIVDTVFINKKAIIAFVKKHRRRPSERKPEEKKLGKACSSYTSKSSDCYDPEFTKELDKLAPIVNTVLINKKAIFDFVKKHGRRPIETRPVEKKLGRSCSKYTSKSSNCYDPEFTEELAKLAPIVDTVFINKKAIIAFVKKHRRRPSKNRPEEKKLGQACSNYTRKSLGSYDPEFVKELDKLAPIVDTVVINKKAILVFVKKHRRRPSQHKPEEKKISQACSNYTSMSHGSYDHDFAAELIKILKYRK